MVLSSSALSVDDPEESADSSGVAQAGEASSRDMPSLGGIWLEAAGREAS